MIWGGLGVVDIGRSPSFVLTRSRIKRAAGAGLVEMCRLALVDESAGVRQFLPPQRGGRAAGEFPEFVDHVGLVDVAALRGERGPVERRLPFPRAERARKTPDPREGLRRRTELPAERLRKALAAHPDLAGDVRDPNVGAAQAPEGERQPGRNRIFRTQPRLGGLREQIEPLDLRPRLR